MSDKESEDKGGLSEFIKKFWLPVAGFLGAVTLAYNFYQLWLGDQRTVTIITGGTGLLILVIVLAWIGFKNKTVEVDTILYKQDQTTAKKVVEIPRFSPKYRSFARIGLFIVFVGFISSTFILIQHRQAVRAEQQYQSTQQAQATQTADFVLQIQSTQNAQTTQQAQEELKEKLVVVIASFDGPEEVYGLRNQILEELNKEYLESENVKIIAIQDIISPDTGSKYAQNLGEGYYADLVIWGWYRPTTNPNITIHVENLSASEIKFLNKSEVFQPYASIAELESFEIQSQIANSSVNLFSFLKGLINYKKGDYQLAIDLFEEVLLENNEPTFVQPFDLYMALGNAYQKNKIPKKSIEYFSQAIEIDPNYSFAYNNRGLGYQDLAQYDQAIEDYNNAIKLNPNFPAAYNNRGNAYLFTDEYELAIQDYDISISLNSDFTSAYTYNNRGSAYVFLGQFNLAVQDFNRAIEIYPEYINPYGNRGTSYYYLGEYELAIKDLNFVIENDPNNVLAYYNLGLIYIKLDDLDKVFENLNKAIEIDPNFPPSYYTRGAVYKFLGKTAEAETDFEKYTELTGQEVP
ncbi:MAG: tetratricopeptide repeat protein [Chloroflexi bacterium]|nr:tetratricopeptide repeat protein [Chloroflexota bacterium]